MMEILQLKGLMLTHATLIKSLWADHMSPHVNSISNLANLPGILNRHKTSIHPLSKLNPNFSIKKLEPNVWTQLHPNRCSIMEGIAAKATSVSLKYVLEGCAKEDSLQRRARITQIVRMDYFVRRRSNGRFSLHVNNSKSLIKVVKMTSNVNWILSVGMDPHQMQHLTQKNVCLYILRQMIPNLGGQVRIRIIHHMMTTSKMANTAKVA